MMNKAVNFLAVLVTGVAFSVAIGLAGFATPVLADPGGEPNSHSDRDGGPGGGSSAGTGAGGVIGETFSNAEPGTVGPTISGELYGNTSNPRPSGHGVLPSLSPGPWVCDGPDCSAQPTAPGGSMGEWLAPSASGGNGDPDFANSKDPGPDFSEPNKP